MTLRDYFAGQALAGLLAHPNTYPRDHETLDEMYDKLGAATYAIADAMLKARER